MFILKNAIVVQAYEPKKANQRSSLHASRGASAKERPVIGRTNFRMLLPGHILLH